MPVRFTAARALAAGTALVIAASACAKKDATTDTATATATSSTVSTVAATNGSTAMTQSQKEDLHDAIHGYRLTEGNVDRTIQAMQRMHALQKSNPQLAATMDQHRDASDAKSVDELASRLDAIPPVKAVLSSVGISARDYVLTTFTLMEAGAAYQFQKAGKLPPNSELAKDVSAENMAYIGAHQGQMQALEKANASSDEE